MYCNYGKRKNCAKIDFKIMIKWVFLDMKSGRFLHWRIGQKHCRKKVKSIKAFNKILYELPLISKAFFTHVTYVRLCYHDFLVLILDSLFMYLHQIFISGKWNTLQRIFNYLKMLRVEQTAQKLQFSALGRIRFKTSLKKTL